MNAEDRDLERRRACKACGADHGSTNAERLCLERALDRARTALREASEALNRT
jgi:hypothetical protein